MKYATFLPARDQRSMPWKGGGGVTTEIAREPALGEDFLWRLSRARVEASGPFSLYAGYTRLLTPLDGALKLVSEKEDVLLRPGEVHEFLGDDAIQAEVTAPLEDLGLIYGAGVRAKLSVIPFAGKPRSFTLDARTVVLFSLGKFRVSAYPGEHVFSLLPGDALRIDEISEERLVLVEPGEAGSRLYAAEMNW